MKSSLLVIDTLDDRREIWSLLHRLSPRDRVRFLARCCETVATVHGNGPKPSLFQMRDTVEQAYRCDRADDRLTNEIYGDLLALGTQWTLDLAAVAVELEQLVKRPGERTSRPR